MKKNWKTTVGGLLFGLAKAVEMIKPEYKPVTDALEFVAIAWLGYSAADKTK